MGSCAPRLIKATAGAAGSRGSGAAPPGPGTAFRGAPPPQGEGSPGRFGVDPDLVRRRPPADGIG